MDQQTAQAINSVQMMILDMAKDIEKIKNKVVWLEENFNINRGAKK